jgi:hypothetical protein
LLGNICLGRQEKRRLCRPVKKGSFAKILVLLPLASWSWFCIVVLGSAS